MRRDGNGIPQKSFAIFLIGGSTHASRVGGGMGGMRGELGHCVGTVKFGKRVAIGRSTNASRANDLVIAIWVIVIVIVRGSSRSRRRFRLFLSNPTQQIVPTRRLLSVSSGSCLGEDGFLPNPTQEIAPSKFCCLRGFFYGHERFGHG